MTDDIIMERYELVTGRVHEISKDTCLNGILDSYFGKTTSFFEILIKILATVTDKDYENMGIDELRSLNEEAYADILGAAYESSYANPDYITAVFEEHALPAEYAKYLCFLYAELRGLIPYAYEGNYEYVTIYGELLIEIYGMFLYARNSGYDSMPDPDGIIRDVDAEDDKMLSVPEAEDIKNALVSFENDYSELILRDRILDSLDPGRDFAFRLIQKSGNDDLRYLYRYGEYISENEIKMAVFLNSLPEESIKRIADTYTEGYRIGFVKAKKPLDKKKTVNIRFPIGFERVVKQAIVNFDEMGLKPVIYRAATISLNRNSHSRIGYTSTSANRQFDFDHQDDRALFFDSEHSSRRLDIMKKAYEEFRAEANTHAGPAVIETFGETPFMPKAKKNVFKLNQNQQKIASAYAAEAGNLVNRYIIGEERSFTIIAFPTPEIGNDFEKIFERTVELNTLDYKLYEGIQQIIIDTLDTADYVHILGKDGNETDLIVYLAGLNDPEHETKFENCVADVNIPVGEVFTSPRLTGTDGLLHVKNVYLDGLLYKNLKVRFKDGCVTGYSCANFKSAKDNEKYFKENVLFNHDTLPMGEFAIGTNTTAYRMARDFGIEDRLPILIGEKTGPHFALGDTCYSREEDVKVYNPDGKEIISKENDFSKLRDTDPSKAYFSCHTDITIPYDELGGIYAHTPDGEIAIIKDGRFALKGCEELNIPL